MDTHTHILSDENENKTQSKKLWKELSVQKGRCIVLLQCFPLTKTHFACSRPRIAMPFSALHQRACINGLIWNTEYQIWMAHNGKKTVQHLFVAPGVGFFFFVVIRTIRGMNCTIRCASIINNLFSVKVHIEAAACWLVSFGKMALILPGKRNEHILQMLMMK